MKVALHVAVSGQVVMRNRIDSIANNVANMTTAGFRADGSRFSTILSLQKPSPVAFASTAGTFIVRTPGAMKPTGNPLDVALRGDVWMALQGPDGVFYTRDGRLRMLPTGELQSVTGHPVLDVGGSPITLRPKGGPPRISRDGMITQGGRKIGAIGLFRIDEKARLTRYGASGVIPDREPEPVVEFSHAGVMQGYVEDSNVNGVLEMARLMEVTNTFRQLSRSVEESERTTLEAIRVLGGSGS